MNGSSAPLKESSLGPSSIQEHDEQMAICEVGSGSSPDTESASAFILDFIASKMMRHKFLAFKSHPLDGVLF